MFTVRGTEKEVKEAKGLLNKIKDITKRPHIYNLLDALKYFLNSLRDK